MQLLKFFLPVFAVCALAQAQTTAARTPFIRASGDGVVSIKPDQARLTLGVTTQGQTAEEATQRNADILTNVLNEVRKAIGTFAEIRTIGFNVSPIYRSPAPGLPSVIAGYTATNSVLVTMSDPNLAGRIIDVGTKAGANVVGGISFSLKDPQPAKAQALRLATQQARAQAEAIAQGLGGRVGRVLAAADSSSVTITSIRDNLGAGVAAGAPTPIESGNLEIRATVTIEAEIVI
jgi:uncharacterized protein YggE